MFWITVSLSIYLTLLLHLKIIVVAPIHTSISTFRPCRNVYFSRYRCHRYLYFQHSSKCGEIISTRKPIIPTLHRTELFNAINLQHLIHCPFNFLFISFFIQYIDIRNILRRLIYIFLYTAYLSFYQ